MASSSSEPAAKAQRTTTVHILNPEPCPSYLQRQRSTGSFSDAAILTSDGKTLRAHRCVLAGISDYFKGLFSSEMSDVVGDTIDLDMPAAAVEAILTYIYEGDCPVDEESLLPLLEAAAYLQIKPLEVETRTHVLSRMTECTCLEVLELARNRSLPDLEDSVWEALPDLLKANSWRILQSPAAQRLPPPEAARLNLLLEPFLARTVKVLRLPKGTTQAPSTKGRKEQLVRDLLGPFVPPGLSLQCRTEKADVSVSYTLSPQLLSPGPSAIAVYYQSLAEPRRLHARLVKTTHLDIGGLALEHHKLNEDRGISFDMALELLHDPDRPRGEKEGFYKSARSVIGMEATDTRAFALLLYREDHFYQVVRPNTGRGASVAIQSFTEAGRFRKLPQDEAKAGWDLLYNMGLTTCFNSACYRLGKCSKSCRQGEPGSKRILRRLDLLSGPCLPLLHGLMHDTAVDNTTVVVAAIVGDGPSTGFPTIRGVLIDKSKLAQLVESRAPE